MGIIEYLLRVLVPPYILNTPFMHLSMYTHHLEPSWRGGLREVIPPFDAVARVQWPRALNVQATNGGP